MKIFPDVNRLCQWNRTVFLVSGGGADAIQAIAQSPLQAADPQELPCLSTAVESRISDDNERERYVKRGYFMHGETAVVPMRGVILKDVPEWAEDIFGLCDIDRFRDRMEMAAEEEPSRIVMWIDSPGGVSTGVPETAEFIRELKEWCEVYAYTDTQMASAAYWVGSQATQVFSSLSADVGNIGGFIGFFNYTDLLKKEGIHFELITEGKYKAAGHPFAAIKDEHLELFREILADTVADFRADVLTGRGQQIEAAHMEGQSLSGKKALAANLTDGIFSRIEDLVEHLESRG